MALARFEHDFTDELGNLIGVAGSVEVRREDTGALAVPYSDRTGASALGNPFSVADGQVAFHVVGGAYKIVATFGADTRTLRYVAIGTGAEQDAEALGRAGYAYEFEAATTAPPLASCIRANNADLSLATKLYVYDSTLGLSDISATLLALDPNGNTSKNRIRLTVGSVDAVFDVDATTDQTTYIEVDVSNHDGSTSLNVGTARLNIEWAGADIADGSVTTAKIADGAVTAAKLATGAVSGASVTRGDTSRPFISIIRDTPPSIADYGGVGDGTTNDRNAIRNCLDEYGICYLPFFKPGTYSPATWYFATEVALTGSMQVIGEDRKPNVKQGAGDNLFVLTGNGNKLKNMLIDPSLQTLRDVSQTTILLNTAVASVESTEIENLQWGLARDRSTILPGFDFLADTPHASNLVVGLDMNDIEVWGAKGYPFYSQRFFADIYHKNILIDWTRQAHVPTYTGFTVNGGEGIFYEECFVQGVGTTGVGNAASHGWDISNGAAIGLRRTRADGVGGNGYKLTNLVGAELTATIGSFCGEEQYLFTNVTKSPVISPYAGGRVGLGWAPALKAGIKVVGGKPLISSPMCLSNTGSGMEFASANGIVVAGGQFDSNIRYGVEESGTSNYNGFTSASFSANTINNGYCTGAASYYSGIMKNSGVSAGRTVPGAATAW